MKTVVLFAWCGLVALGATACSKARDTGTGTAFCFNCHSETTALGKKIKWAEAGYATSVHSEGQVERVYTQLSPQGGCPAFVQATAATCTNNGGSHSGAAGGNICTMPLGTTPATCAAAGGTYAAAVDDAVASSACPTFAQVSAGTTLCAQVFGAGAYAAPTCTPAVPAGATYITQNACQSAGGLWVGPSYILTGIEHAGSNAFYANSGGCQICHTQEGFRKRVAGAYDVPGSYSIQFQWSTLAQVGSPSTTPNTPLTQDVILNPSPLGCFGCHTPHGIGTADNVHLDQTVPVGTAVTTQTGAIWGNATTGTNKAKGHMCAECHQIRLNSQPSTSASILGSLTGTGKFNVSAPYGTHHGPQADMILGKGGAEYSGTANGGTFTFAGTYAHSNHSVNVNADCVSCHMQSDYADINVTGSFGVDAAVGGHSFTNKAFVHGAEKTLALGCGSVTDGVGCHTVAGVTGSSGNLVASASIAKTFGYLQAGDAYFQKSTSPTSMVDSNYQFKVNELLTRLANPSANCSGLLQSAATVAGGALGWTTMSDGFTIDPRCIVNGTLPGKGVNKAAAPADDNTNASVRFVKGLWNFKFWVEDKSFGVHNTTYLLELLYDSCTDLALLTGQSCGANAGRCSFCEGPFVTTRP
jgi:hypothetical protein